MYNADIKSKFVSQFSTSLQRKKLAITLFNAIAPYEEKWGSDFCTRKLEDIEPVINDIIGVRTTSYSNRVSVLKEYVKWCIDNNVDGVCDDLLTSANLAGTGKIKHQMVANPRHLQEYLNCICDPESMETVDCVYRCFYWLAYSGIMNQEDALDVSKNDVDLGNMIIIYDNREYEIYRESINAFRNCKELKFFRCNHPNYNEPILRERIESDKLLSGIKSLRTLKSFRAEVSKLSRIHKRVKILDENLDLKPSYYRVWLSGTFYRYLEMERAGVEADFAPLARDFINNSIRKNGELKTPYNVMMTDVIRNFKKDYIRWKEAYSV